MTTSRDNARVDAALRSSDSAPLHIDSVVFEHRWQILAVLCTSLMVVIVGNTALNVALPTLARELNASTSAQQWMVDAYALVFAGMLFTAGTIGDRFGRKGALQFGLLVFLGGSLFSAFMDSASAIIIGRGVMGFGAAFVMPATLSILTNVFPPDERGRAIAIWAAISGAGIATGPVASGFLLKHFSWGSVFLINVPIVAVALASGYVLLPKSKDPEPDRPDFAGAVLSIVGLGALVYAIIEAPDHGWTSGTSFAWFGLAAALIAAFLVWELRCNFPMLNLRYFLDPRFGVASGVITLISFALLGFMFIVTQYFQLVLGYSALEAGAKQLPFAVVLLVFAPRSPQLAMRFGVNVVVAFGLGCVSLAMFLFAVAGVDTSYSVLLPLVVLLALGMSMVIPLMTGSIMSAVPRGKAGAGSAMNDATRELGGALGVAVLGSVVASRYDSRLSAGIAGLTGNLRGKADESLAGALQTASQIGGRDGQQLARVAREAFVSGMRLASIVAGCGTLLASVFVYRCLPANNSASERLPSAGDAEGAVC